MSKNYYIILGIPVNSTQDDIKIAYRKLAKEFHPDHFGNNHLPFLDIQEAYSILSDSLRRKTYDNSLNQTKRYRHRFAEPLKNFKPDNVEPLIPTENFSNIDDILLLDEPTNDLDIPTLEVLEESLEEFSGSVVLISHDRFLMNRLCDILCYLDNDGIPKFFSDFDQWLNYKNEIMHTKIFPNETKNAKSQLNNT